jgi:uridine kinase
MPLIVMVGLPSSGKSTWAKKAADYFRTEKQKTVHVLREEDLFRGEKNDILDGENLNFLSGNPDLPALLLYFILYHIYLKIQSFSIYVPTYN